MKITLDITEMSVTNVYNLNSYEKEGLYLVNDGITYMLVYYDGEVVATLGLPNKLVLDEYIREELKQAQVAEKDFHSILESKLERVNKGIDYITEMLHKPAETKEVIESNGNNFDLKELTNMLAISQKPDLLKEIRK